MTNWKTNLFGAITILLTFAGPVLDAYVPIKGLNWLALMSSLAGIAGGTGLILAKDSTTHSTPEQVAGAAKIEPPPPSPTQ